MFAKLEHKYTAAELVNSLSAVGSPSRRGKQGPKGTHAHSRFNKLSPHRQPAVMPLTTPPPKNNLALACKLHG